MDGSIASSADRGVTSVDEFLAHYGVKGMKWGVRKSDKLGDFVVSKDNPIYNISSNAPRDAKGHVYAAFTKNDVINYRSMYVAQLASFVGASKVFSNAFELKGDLKVAGKNAQVEAFKKLWEKDKEGIAKTLAESQVDISIVAALINKGLKIDRTKAYEKRFMDASEDYMMKKGYKQFQTALAIPGNKMTGPYYSLLAKRGYSALLDMNDVRAFNAEKPILIFKGKDHLRNRDTVELTDTDLQLAMDTYWDPKKLEKYDVKELHSKKADKGEEVEHMSAVDDFLAHYGVKGMKWGVRRKTKGPSSTEAERKTAVKTQAKKEGVRTLSNKDLQDAITRMNLEQQFKRLSVNEKPVVSRFIASTLLEIGKREVQTAVAKKVAGAVARKAVTGGVG